jgi:hypothetical protein
MVTVDQDELRELLTEIREATQEAHGVLKDLRTETKRAERLLPMIVTNRIRSEVNKQMEELGKEVREHMATSVATVERSIKGLYARLIGKDHFAKKEGLRSLPTIIDDLADAEIEPDDLPLSVPPLDTHPLGYNLMNYDPPRAPSQLIVVSDQEIGRRLRRILDKGKTVLEEADDEGNGSS